MEGTLPLHLAERLTQAEIGALYVGLALVVAASAAAAGSQRPRSMVFGSVFLAVAGISVAGAVTQVPLWVLALALAALGVGIGSTGSLGILVEAVNVKRIVTAMVVWSQVGIAGYLVGPLAGGLVAEELGYSAVALVVAVAGLAVLGTLAAARGMERSRRPWVSALDCCRLAGHGRDPAAPVLIAYDGSDVSRAAVRHAAELFAGRPAVLATVWEPGMAAGRGGTPGPHGRRPPPPDRRHSKRSIGSRASTRRRWPGREPSSLALSGWSRSRTPCPTNSTWRTR